jgi:23S rRNA (cytosine1962-C5)-methyltransferase
MLQIYLKQGREAPVRRGHPWIFSGAIERTHGDAVSVGVADVFDSRKTWIARGLYNPDSQIRVRLLTAKDEPIDGDFFRRRIARAVALRGKYVAPQTNSFRLINGEGDFLPGLVVDRYADFLVCQFMTAGMEKHKPIIADILLDARLSKGVFERSDGKVRAEEGLGPSVGILLVMRRYSIVFPTAGHSVSMR